MQSTVGDGVEDDAERGDAERFVFRSGLWKKAAFAEPSPGIDQPYADLGLGHRVVGDAALVGVDDAIEARPVEAAVVRDDVLQPQSFAFAEAVEAHRALRHHIEHLLFKKRMDRGRGGPRLGDGKQVLEASPYPVPVTRQREDPLTLAVGGHPEGSGAVATGMRLRQAQLCGEGVASPADARASIGPDKPDDTRRHQDDGDQGDQAELRG